MYLVAERPEFPGMPVHVAVAVAKLSQEVNPAGLPFLECVLVPSSN